MAGVRASIERQPVIPWVKVKRPPALHLHRTFAVEKWVRPSDLTVRERKIYDEGQRQKEEGRRRLLNLEQQRREEREKEKDEQLGVERKEIEQSPNLLATITQGNEKQMMESKKEELPSTRIVSTIANTGFLTAAKNGELEPNLGTSFGEARNTTTIAPALPTTKTLSFEKTNQNMQGDNEAPRK